MSAYEVDLGCGLITIGREWGTTLGVPSEIDAMHFLEKAYMFGVRFFDTAPSYGLSEKRLGSFLRHLTPHERQDVTVATKFGEQWDADTNTGYMDHSLDSLRRSLDTSMGLLGSVTILQLHKATAELLDSNEVNDAFEYAREAGVGSLGVSVSDVSTANKALQDKRFSFLQLPYNQDSLQFTPIVQQAHTYETKLIINRPLRMGKAVNPKATVADKDLSIDSAFRFILEQDYQGFILSGTSNVTHLRENIDSFQRVKAQL